MAGSYPGAPEPEKARKKLAKILDAGVRTFVNLMEPDETNYDGSAFTPYGPIADELAAERRFKLTHLRFPIRDRNVPAPKLMEEILVVLDAALSNGGAVYLHCCGGHGGTGMVVGCHLIRKGEATPENFVEVIADRRAEVTEKLPSPETPAQVAFVRSFAKQRQKNPVPAISQEDRYLGCFLGLAAGDAVGTTVEFKHPGTFPPVTDMVGGGTFGLKPGQWTDDTSMALCLAESLIDRQGFDPIDLLGRYVRWRDKGHLSSTGEAFDVGGTIGAALARFDRTHKPWCGSTDPYTAGNSSLMRLAPVPMAYANDPKRP